MKNLRYGLVHGDNVRVMKQFKEASVNLIVTSPPYGNMRSYANGYIFDFEGLAQECYRVLTKGGVLVWVVGDQTKNGSETFDSLRQALYFRDVCGFNAHDTMIYYRHGPPLTHNRYEQAWEYMFVFSKGSPAVFNGIQVPKSHPEKKTRVKGYSREKNGIHDKGRNRVDKTTRLDYNVWKFTKSTSDKYAHQHPAIYPEELAERHVITWTNPGDVVLDPFCGSGTTGKMSLRNDRKFIGIDISYEYLEIAKRRINETRGRKKKYEIVTAD